MTLSSTLTRAIERRLPTQKLPPKDPRDQPITNLDLSGFDWSGLGDEWTEDVILELSRAYLAFILDRAPSIGEERAKQLATEYAQERAGELIGGKFDIGEATRDRVKEVVAQAIDNGFSLRQLASALHDDIAFSAVRAMTIARTETATALGQGSKAAAAEMGQDEKSWVDQGATACGICSGNVHAGWIAADDSFPDGSDTIPAHDRCECDVIYRTAEKAVPQVLAVARCAECGRWLGRDVNAGARVYCPRCRTDVGLTA